MERRGGGALLAVADHFQGGAFFLRQIQQFPFLLSGEAHLEGRWRVVESPRGMGFFVAYLKCDGFPIELGVDEGQGYRVLLVYLPRVVLCVSVQEVKEDCAAQFSALVLYRKDDGGQILRFTSPRTCDWRVRRIGSRSHHHRHQHQFRNGMHSFLLEASVVRTCPRPLILKRGRTADLANRSARQLLPFAQSRYAHGPTEPHGFDHGGGNDDHRAAFLDRLI